MEFTKLKIPCRVEKTFRNNNKKNELSTPILTKVIADIVTCSKQAWWRHQCKRLNFCFTKSAIKLFKVIAKTNGFFLWTRLDTGHNINKTFRSKKVKSRSKFWKNVKIFKNSPHKMAASYPKSWFFSILSAIFVFYGKFPSRMRCPMWDSEKKGEKHVFLACPTGYACKNDCLLSI